MAKVLFFVAVGYGVWMVLNTWFLPRLFIARPSLSARLSASPAMTPTNGQNLLLGLPDGSWEWLTYSEGAVDTPPRRRDLDPKVPILIINEDAYRIIAGGTRVRLLRVNERATRVRVMEGPLRGEAGWVETTNLWELSTPVIVEGSAGDKASRSIGDVLGDRPSRSSTNRPAGGR